ncbi:MAG: D-2-hydroxyacid dehydrogenase [Candidatus Limnocylindria bacterium]
MAVGDGTAVEAAAGAEAAVGWPDAETLRALLAASPDLRWLHTMSAGVDRLMIPEVVERDRLVVTNNSGAFDVPIAEHVLATILAAAKHLPQRFAAQRRRQWREGGVQHAEIRDATLVVLGMGSIGGEIARLAAACGMRVIGVRRRATTTAPPGVRVVGVERLDEVVAEADHLAIAAPLTAETRGIVSADLIARLKPTAWVINIARGALVDEPALLAACKERRIGGAALDVFLTEPLPPDSEWWTLPNAIVTPHVSNSSPRVRERSIGLLLENLRRFKSGEPLLNVVDKRAGY